MITPEMIDREVLKVVDGTGASFDVVKQLVLEAFISGMNRFAWWEDGIQMCGTCGITFSEARIDVLKTANVQPKTKQNE